MDAKLVSFYLIRQAERQNKRTVCSRAGLAVCLITDVSFPQRIDLSFSFTVASTLTASVKYQHCLPEEKKKTEL